MGRLLYSEYRIEKGIDLFSRLTHFVKVTTRIPDGLDCGWMIPLLPKDNSKLRPGEKHDLRFGFLDPAAAPLLHNLSFLRCDNSWLIPLALLTPIGSEEFPRLDLSAEDLEQ